MNQSVSEIKRTLAVSARAAALNFDWAEPVDILSKVEEEVGEIREAYSSGSSDEVEEELGDLLFTVLNAFRLFGVDPLEALKASNDKFESRFDRMQSMIAGDGRVVSELTFEELDAYWCRVKEEGY